MFFFNQMGTVFEMGFIYAVVALGVYITYKILDFPTSRWTGPFLSAASYFPSCW